MKKRFPEGTKQMNLKLPVPLALLLDEATRKDMHISKQELVREAIREHMRREYPELHEKYKERIR